MNVDSVFVLFDIVSGLWVDVCACTLYIWVWVLYKVCKLVLILLLLKENEEFSRKIPLNSLRSVSSDAVIFLCSPSLFAIFLDGASSDEVVWYLDGFTITKASLDVFLWA